MLKLSKEWYLLPIYDKAKSFYKKAIIIQNENYIILKSYDTLVLVVDLRFKQAYLCDTYSVTTLRHIKEVLTQLDFKCEGKQQIIKDYMTSYKEFSYYLTKATHSILNIN